MKNMKVIILLTSLSLFLIFGMSTQFIFHTDAYAQINQGHGHFHSLKEILKDRNVGEPLSCPNPEHVLVLRPNTDWACVYFETTKYLNWDTVLYSEPNAPQISTSVFYGDNVHYITYQTNEGVVDSIELYSDTGNDIDWYDLKISITPTQKGDLTVTFPSIESDMFENYCIKFNRMSNSHYFLYLIDDREINYEEINVNDVTTTIKFPYEYDSKIIEIVLACHI